jgi:hypothetical protein
LWILNATWATCWCFSSFAAILYDIHKGVWPRVDCNHVQERAYA